jgi:hypothetical protein
MLLSTHPNLQACDDFYEALIATHQGLEPRKAMPSMPAWCCCWPITSAIKRPCCMRSNWPAPAQDSLLPAQTRPSAVP